MRHLAAEAGIQERAALYALGALGQWEARAFEAHIAEGCEVCARELDSLRSVVDVLGLASGESQPPDRTRLELLARISKDDAGRNEPQIQSVRAGEGKWRGVGEGIELKILSVNRSQGTTTSLVRMRPGARLPRHRHGGLEQIYVLEGDCRVQGIVLGPGDYHRAEPGSVHEETTTIHGTMYLMVGPLDYEFEGQRA